MLVFLIIDFNILGHVEKRNYFQRIPYFQTATCYNSSLVLSRLDPALVKAAYNIACAQLNGNTLITLCYVNDVGKSVDPFTTAFSGYQGHACTR